MTHIAVLGAGITGVTTAFQLLERGYDVTVFDRNRYAAMETSFANGGQLSASNAEVWTNLSTVLKGLKWMVQSDAPLLVNPLPTWHKARWMTEFLSNIPNYRKHTVATVKLALAARPLLLEMADRAGVDFNLEKRGILHIYRDASELAKGRKVSALLAEGGLHRDEISGNDVKSIEPTLSGDYAGGFFTKSDMTGDIHKFSSGLAGYLSRAGVTFRYGVSVSELRTVSDGVIVNGEQFDGVVVSAGVASRWMASALGDRVNVYPVKGYSITVNLTDEASRAAAPQVSLLDEAAKIVTSRFGPDRFRIAGTAEFTGENRDIRAARIKPLVKWVERTFPDVSTEDVEQWAGLRPMMPSMMPKIGAGKHPRVFYNTGHGHLGWTLSGATSALVADAVSAALPAVKRPQPLVA
jgi:D-amino-acid dehydrogenase